MVTLVSAFYSLFAATSYVKVLLGNQSIKKLLSVCGGDCTNNAKEHMKFSYCKIKIYFFCANWNKMLRHFLCWFNNCVFDWSTFLLLSIDIAQLLCQWLRSVGDFRMYILLYSIHFDQTKCQSMLLRPQECGKVMSFSIRVIFTER